MVPEGTFVIWNIDGTEVKTVTVTKYMLDRCLFKRRKIYLSGGDNTAKLWTADGTPIRTLKG
jgi:hypothetical protein